MKRPFAIILAALLLTFGSTAWAQAAPGAKASPPGQEKKQDDKPAEKAKEDKPTPAGQAKKEDNPAPQGKAKEDKPTPPGKAKDSTGPGNDSATPPGQGTSGGKSKPKPDQDAAQDAVETEQALPLVEIVKIAKSLNDGRVVNARLLRINGVLLYQLTMLDESGRSWRDYYLARSGNPVSMP